jgi:hypothetical protein
MPDLTAQPAYAVATAAVAKRDTIGSVGIVVLKVVQFGTRL